MCGKVKSVKQADCERNGLKALFELGEMLYSICHHIFPPTVA